MDEFLQSIPGWLEIPVLTSVVPPIHTKSQLLPLDKLSWEDFEKLCLRLARLNGEIEFCRLYGKRGQAQAGIDLYARNRLAEKYVVYQCKKVKNVSPAIIKSAVNKFLEGKWVGKTESFVLCTSDYVNSTDCLDEIEKQQNILSKKGISFIIWDSSEISLQLKEIPKLVDDFFGRSWVSEFCGDQIARELGSRLDRSAVCEYRKKMGDFYKHVFNTLDPGLPLKSLPKAPPLPLEHRYVFPDIISSNRLISDDTISPEKLKNIREEEYKAYTYGKNFGEKELIGVSPVDTEAFQQRQGIENWLFNSTRSILLGGPGSGKTTFLRFLMIDLLSDLPKLTLLANKWGQFLPVWIPFAQWTKLISDNPSAASLPELLQTWLKSWGEDELWPLVDGALTDERLLLLVDGLDEWTNESCAKIAVNMLNVFIDQRKLPTIVTSRPHGFYRLGIHENGWQIGELCSFSFNQQLKYAEIWFEHKNRELHVGNWSDSEIRCKVIAEAKDFLDELQRAPAFIELAKVPLLLSLLMFHKFFDAYLPQSRFKAYDSLIEHLISEHPQRRKVDSMIYDSSKISGDDLKKVLAYLAYYIHVNSTEGILDCNRAYLPIEQYLQEDMGLSPREAKESSRLILDSSQDTTGILVRKSPVEIGFFHRVFQEYLAAYYLSFRPMEEQVEVITNHCFDPQWNEVILSLFNMTRREGEVKEFLEAIRTRKNQGTTIENCNVDLLAYEVAFGEFNTPIKLAKEIAEEAFQTIETHYWLEHRKRVLSLALEGLRSSKFKDLLKRRLKTWYPCKANFREDFYKAISAWPIESQEVIEFCWKGLFDEAVYNKRSAANMLKKLAVDNTFIIDRLIKVVRLAYDNTTRAVALETLISGWHDDARIIELIDHSYTSLSPELQLMAVYGKIRLELHTEDDLNKLFDLAVNQPFFRFEWKNVLTDCIISGWPGSPLVKKRCFQALKEKGKWKNNIDHDIALTILLLGFPQDDDVAAYCAGEISTEEHPFLMVNLSTPWDLLMENFKDHPALIEPIDTWMGKEEFYEPAIASAAMVGRTATGKAKLISMLGTSSVPHWPARSLIKGWGMGDSEVKAALEKIAMGDADRASRVAFLLPDIMSDKDECRARLISILKNEKCSRHDFVLAGLSKLGQTQGDKEVVQILLDLFTTSAASRIYEHVNSKMFIDYSFDPRVRELALGELNKRNNSIQAIAYAYGNDQEIREKLFEGSTPLLASLRRQIVDYYSNECCDYDFAISQLRSYACDCDQEVKVQGSIGYYSLMKKLNKGDSIDFSKLKQDIVCYGHDYETQRQAAFCGLVILDKLDIMLDAQESIGNEKRCSISVHGTAVHPNTSFLRFIAKEWPYLKNRYNRFGDELLFRLNKFKSSESYFWNAISLFADDSAAAKNDVLKALEKPLEGEWDTNLLSFLARVRPQSKLLLDYCIRAITEKQGFWRSRQTVELAAEIIGAHFGNEEAIKHHVLSLLHNNDMGRKVLVLCGGWPNSKELDAIWEFISHNNVEMTYTEWLQLFCHKASSEQLINMLLEAIESVEQYPTSISGVEKILALRIKSDDSVFENLMYHLKTSSHPSYMASLPKIIFKARGLSAELRQWYECQLVNVQAGFAEVGFDIIDGFIRPVEITLLNLYNRKFH